MLGRQQRKGWMTCQRRSMVRFWPQLRSPSISSLRHDVCSKGLNQDIYRLSQTPMSRNGDSAFALKRHWKLWLLIAGNNDFIIFGQIRVSQKERLATTAFKGRQVGLLCSTSGHLVPLTSYLSGQKCHCHSSHFSYQEK